MSLRLRLHLPGLSLPISPSSIDGCQRCAEPALPSPPSGAKVRLLTSSLQTGDRDLFANITDASTIQDIHHCVHRTHQSSVLNHILLLLYLPPPVECNAPHHNYCRFYPLQHVHTSEPMVTMVLVMDVCAVFVCFCSKYQCLLNMATSVGRSSQ